MTNFLRHSFIFLSFYLQKQCSDDETVIRAKAESLGLTLQDTSRDGECFFTWVCLAFGVDPNDLALRQLLRLAICDFYVRDLIYVNVIIIINIQSFFKLLFIHTGP